MKQLEKLGNLSRSRLEHFIHKLEDSQKVPDLDWHLRDARGLYLLNPMTARATRAHGTELFKTILQQFSNLSGLSQVNCKYTNVGRPVVAEEIWWGALQEQQIPNLQKLGIVDFSNLDDHPLKSALDQLDSSCEKPTVLQDNLRRVRILTCAEFEKVFDDEDWTTLGHLLPKLEVLRFEATMPNKNFFRNENTKCLTEAGQHVTDLTFSHCGIFIERSLTLAIMPILTSLKILAITDIVFHEKGRLKEMFDELAGSCESLVNFTLYNVSYHSRTKLNVKPRRKLIDASLWGFKKVELLHADMESLRLLLATIDTHRTAADLPARWKHCNKFEIVSWGHQAHLQLTQMGMSD